MMGNMNLKEPYSSWWPWIPLTLGTIYWLGILCLYRGLARLLPV